MYVARSRVSNRSLPPHLWGGWRPRMRMTLQYLRVYPRLHRRSPTQSKAWASGGVHPLPSVHYPRSHRHLWADHPPHNLIDSSTAATLAMSQTPSTAAASSRFQAVFNAALRSYEQQTKKDLIAHPLASQLQTCDSTSAIPAVLQDQVREFDQSRSGDERLTMWLNPTVAVLCAFSAALGEGVGPVSLDTRGNVSLEASP